MEFSCVRCRKKQKGVAVLCLRCNGRFCQNCDVRRVGTSEQGYCVECCADLAKQGDEWRKLPFKIRQAHMEDLRESKGLPRKFKDFAPLYLPSSCQPFNEVEYFAKKQGKDDSLPQVDGSVLLKNIADESKQVIDNLDKIIATPLPERVVPANKLPRPIGIGHEGLKALYNERLKEENP